MTPIDWLPPTRPFLSHSQSAQSFKLLHKEAPHGDLQKVFGRGHHGVHETALPLMRRESHKKQNYLSAAQTS
jgi:hypothetical protein